MPYISVAIYKQFPGGNPEVKDIFYTYLQKNPL